jgi:hypothetical protein
LGISSSIACLRWIARTELPGGGCVRHGSGPRTTI